MKIKTIFQKQMILYMGILFALFGFFGAGISIVYTNQYIKEQEQQLIVQGERFKESMNRKMEKRKKVQNLPGIQQTIRYHGLLEVSYMKENII